MTRWRLLTADADPALGGWILAFYVVLVVGFIAALIATAVWSYTHRDREEPTDE